MAEAFKSEVFRLARAPVIEREHRFRSQLIEAARSPAKNIAEGFVRRTPRSFATYLDYALASLSEAELHLRDAIELGYVAAPDCDAAFNYARRCLVATIRLKHS